VRISGNVGHHGERGGETYGLRTSWATKEVVEEEGACFLLVARK